MSATSYWGLPDQHLDPALFDGETVRGDVRQRIIGALYSFWGSRYANPQSWVGIYLAGSGVSYHWSAARDPGDLDTLLIVNYVRFRQANPEFQQMSNAEIAQTLNEELIADLWPKTAQFQALAPKGRSTYELTYYINVAARIDDMHPYAAYDLVRNEWVVSPSKWHILENEEGERQVASDEKRAKDISRRFNQGLSALEGLHNPNATSVPFAIRRAVAEGAELWEEIHSGRKGAYSPEGQGLTDPREYRYKGAKRTGIDKLLRQLSTLADRYREEEETRKYGEPLANPVDLVRRAALARRYG